MLSSLFAYERERRTACVRWSVTASVEKTTTALFTYARNERNDDVAASQRPFVWVKEMFCLCPKNRKTKLLTGRYLLCSEQIGVQCRRPKSVSKDFVAGKGAPMNHLAARSIHRAIDGNDQPWTPSLKRHCSKLTSQSRLQLEMWTTKCHPSRRWRNLIELGEKKRFFRISHGITSYNAIMTENVWQIRPDLVQDRRCCCREAFLSGFWHLFVTDN